MRLRAYLFVLLLCWLSLPLTVLAQPTVALDIDAYWQQIDALQTELDDIPAEDEVAYEEWLGSTATQLENIDAIVLGDGRSIPINHAPIIAILETDPPPTRERVSELFTSWVETRRGMLNFSTADLDSLREILADDRFIYGEEPPLPAWRQWINERIAEILRFFSRGGGLLANDLTGNILSAASVIVLVLVFAYILRNLVGNFTPEATLQDEFGEEEIPLNAEMALERAQTLSTGGDYRTAVRYLYLSSLLMLEERGLLRYNRSLTNREYLKAVAHRPELVQWLQPVIDVFDRVWYGYQPLSKEEYTQYQHWVEGLKKTDA